MKENPPSDQTFQTLEDIDQVTNQSLRLVEDLLKESEKLRTRRDIANRNRFARLLKDASAISLTMSLTDEVMRMNSSIRASRTLRRISKKASARGLGLFDSAGLKLISGTSFFTPSLVMKIVDQRVRMASKGIILPSEETLLARHIHKRNTLKIQLNINVLGEAVLGNHEADERLQSVIEMIRRSDVNYASVKISSIASQLITIDHDGSVSRVCDKLRILYREAVAHGVFINLDMEEFRDLAITVEVFKKLLSEHEFASLNAGIVLQAYLPESHSAFADLVLWSRQRHKDTGAWIKIRLVKGANLAMEKAEAQIHGWIPAPYETKADVDASYARLIDVALRPENAEAVRIGVASHNLFHVAWALEVAKKRGVTKQLDIEMLEGMANAEALAIVNLTGAILLYTPVTKRSDFPVAVAYLVRRLDENTSIENYLRASFEMSIGNPRFKDQKERFLKSIAQRHEISVSSRRHATKIEKSETQFALGEFENQSDGDATNPHYRNALSLAWPILFNRANFLIPLVIDGQSLSKPDDCENGVDPNDNKQTWYQYSVADIAQVDLAVVRAKAGVSFWEGLGSDARSKILGKAASIMESERAITIAVMARDSGKTVSEADPEVSEAIDFARFYAISAREQMQTSAPLGVIVVVPPWNFPYAIPAGGICSALASGNTVIIKSAPETVATSWQLVQQLWKAGVPKEALHFVSTRDDEVGKHLVTHQDVAGVILTGAFTTAQMFTSWKPNIRLMAETSGKNAILISASADIDGAVKDLVQSAFGHAGQKCSAASLGIVEKSIFENPAFIRQLKDAVESIRVGPGFNYATTMGPVINPPTGALLRALTTVDDGESWLVEPKQLDTSGNQWSPGVKLGVQPNTWSHRNEWFGPVLGIMCAEDLETAIKWQNDVDFGLTAGFHSLDQVECELWASQIEAGNLYINRGTTGAVVNRQPFGGWKQSSVGPTSKAGGVNYLNNLRNWEEISSLDSTTASSSIWWSNVGSRALDPSALSVERNYQRYRKPLHPIIVRVDATIPHIAIEYVQWLAEKIEIQVELSSLFELVGVASQSIESVEALIARTTRNQKLRWLSNEASPTLELLNRGVSVDTRPIVGAGHVEVPRWLLEQSVSITNHRYGNVGAGPRPQID